LDLPSDAESDDGESLHDEDEINEDSDDLDEYYRELGIDPAEMRPAGSEPSKSKKKTKKGDSDAVYETRPKVESTEETKQKMRSELLNKMMTKCRE